MNALGEMVIPCQFETDYSSKNTFKFQEGIAAVLKNGKYGYIDKSGNTVVPFENDVALPMEDGKVLVWKNKSWEQIKVR